MRNPTAASIAALRGDPLQAALRVSYLAVAWSSLSGLAAVLVALRAQSTALLGSGAGILADVISSVVLIARFQTERSGNRSPRITEQLAQRVSSGALVAVALGLVSVAIERLASGAVADPSAAAISIAAISALVLPLLARRKYAVARAVPSAALRMDAHITVVGAGTAALSLLGLILTSALGWSSPDPVAALMIAVVAGRSGGKGLSATIRRR
jgi:divalent metal cation (Fe/Co/Zn/Cd) transporter